MEDESKTQGAGSDPKRGRSKTRARDDSKKRAGKKPPHTKKTPTYPSERPLNERQVRFVEAYRATGNGAESARQAGYSGTPQALGVHAARLLKDARVARE